MLRTNRKFDNSERNENNCYNESLFSKSTAYLGVSSMHFKNQQIIPATRNIKDFEELTKTNFEYIILLECYLTQIQSLVNMAKANGKKVLIHADMIKGLKHDEYAAQFLCQVIKPAGLISTHPSVISVARKHKLISVTRLFLIDSYALNTAYRMLEKCPPDYIEVMPGVVPNVIQEIHTRTALPIIAGGLIRTIDDVNTIIDAGACAVTTSDKNILKSKNYQDK